MVIADCRMELLHIKYIVKKAKLVIKLHVDNQNAMQIANNGIYNV